MMKNYLPALLVLCAFSSYGQPPDTSGGRYSDALFTQVTVTSNVNYGSAMTVFSTPQTLLLDVYEPSGDTVQMRPLLIFAHGGSFLGGSKTDQDIVELCNRFARMGYVCVSIEYRLGIGLPVDSFHAGRAVIRAVQDMKAAIRYFRQDYALGNTYRIHPDYIFAGGSSAGAFTALHLAYMDSSEVPAYLNITSLDGLEGTSGNPGYSSHVKGVISLCGALADSSWIHPGDVPFISMHGNLDQIVPYGSATVVVFGFPVLRVDGSASLNVRTSNIQVNNPFYTWWGADHVPYAGSTASAIAYMDTTVDFIRSFLRPQLGMPVGTAEAEAGQFRMYPNPANQFLTILPAAVTAGKMDVLVADLSGRTVEHRVLGGGAQQLDISRLARGLYSVRVILAGRTTVKKLVVD